MDDQDFGGIGNPGFLDSWQKFGLLNSWTPMVNSFVSKYLKGNEFRGPPKLFSQYHQIILHWPLLFVGDTNFDQVRFSTKHFGWRLSIIQHQSDQLYSVHRRWWSSWTGDLWKGLNFEGNFKQLTFTTARKDARDSKETRILKAHSSIALSGNTFLFEGLAVWYSNCSSPFERFLGPRAPCIQSNLLDPGCTRGPMQQRWWNWDCAAGRKHVTKSPTILAKMIIVFRCSPQTLRVHDTVIVFCLL